jgi:hypothetical protein
VFTAEMRTALDQALKADGKPDTYQVVDLDTLPASDARRGYPTPTVLFNNHDVFDLPVPQPPFPEPS